MKRLAWFTDLHLEFVKQDAEIQKFDSLCQRIRDLEPDGVLLGGDTAVSGSFERTMCDLEEKFEAPIYFVFGNHDCYYGSIESTRAASRNLTQRCERLTWLTEAGVVPISEKTCLIGDDSWADGRLGNGSRSSVRLNDYQCIKEFEWMSSSARYELMNELGDQAAVRTEKKLLEALDAHSEIIFLTHAPPFREACWHEGKVSDDEFLPHFSCKAVGDTLRRIMADAPNKNLTVLCGHTHSSGEAQISPNLRVRTGAAVYRSPELQDVLNVD